MSHYRITAKIDGVPRLVIVLVDKDLAILAQLEADCATTEDELISIRQHYSEHQMIKHDAGNIKVRSMLEHRTDLPGSAYRYAKLRKARLAESQGR